MDAHDAVFLLEAREERIIVITAARVDLDEKWRCNTELPFGRPESTAAC